MPIFAALPSTTSHFRLVWLLLAIAVCIRLPAAAAQAWPAAQPIRWVVAYPAGGGSDYLARTLAPAMGKRLGQTILIDNRPGAAGIIGTEAAAKSAADGYTLLTGDNGAFVFHEAMYRKLPYSPGDFTPVGLMARFPMILAVNPATPFTSGAALLAELKKSPGTWSYASPGVGSPHHLAMELLKQRQGIDMLHVPYRGLALALQDVIGGSVPILAIDSAAGLAHIKAGKLRALAVMSSRRLASLPEVPTLDELGVRGFEVTAWNALFVRKGTPTPIVTALEAAMQAAIGSPEVSAQLESFGLEVVAGNGAALGDFLQRETAFWHRLIRERGLRAD